jgi:uncharacterized protein YecE (DUF72 family)
MLVENESISSNPCYHLEKKLALLIQLTSSLKITEGIENLRQHIIHERDDRFRYAIEIRDRTWFQDLAYNSADFTF